MTGQVTVKTDISATTRERITDISKQSITIAGKTYGAHEIDLIPEQVGTNTLNSAVTSSGTNAVTGYSTNAVISSSPSAGLAGSVSNARTTGSAGMMAELKSFLQEWFSPQENITVKTSGSTGTPKLMQVSKQHMMNSAVMTLDFLQLQAGDKALLCLPLAYIASKMMVVRSLVGGLDLQVVAPSGLPLDDLAQLTEPMPHLEASEPTATEGTPHLVASDSQPGPDAPERTAGAAEFAVPELDFAAMIPLQVFNHLQSAPGIKRLQAIKHLIIGGGAVDSAMATLLKDFPQAVWSTYGMTETLSHIALRRLSGANASPWYTPFAHVTLSKSVDDTLVIQAPLVCPQKLVTNDIVRFNEQGQFAIVGRKDNTINTGGIKVQIETLEAKLQELVPHCPLMITARPHEKLGEQIVLLLAPADEAGTDALATAAAAVSAATTSAATAASLSKIRAVLSELSPYERPKVYLSVAALPVTGNQKPDRAGAKRLVLEQAAAIKPLV